jgi:hypothetical protein
MADVIASRTLDGPPEEVLAKSARFLAGWTCWACGEPTKEPVVKPRRERHVESFGVYHDRCEPRWDET